VDEQLTRRRLLQLGLALPVPLVLAACSGDEEQASLAPTPACDDGDEPTAEQTEGPFFTPDSPGEPRNANDGIFDPALVLTMAEPGSAHFDFVLESV